MNRDFEELQPHERKAFDELTKENAPPSFLEERIVAALKQSNLIRSPKPSWWPSYPKIAVAVAASLLLLVLGAWAGIKWVSAPRQATTPEFMLVLRTRSGESQTKSPDEVLRTVKEYSNWAGDVRQSGLLVQGEKLKREARIIRAVDGRVAVSEDQASSADGVIAGYFLIQAQDFDGAVKIAKGCPHLKYGGTIEVRQIDRF